MSRIPINYLCSWIGGVTTSFLSAVIFYTIVPIPAKLTNNWSRIARWSPVVGLCIGLLLALLDILLQFCRLPDLTRSALIVAAWVGIILIRRESSVNTSEKMRKISAERFAVYFQVRSQGSPV